MTPSPKQVADQVSSLLREMKKRGEASITVTRVPHAADPDFSTNPPSCRVTVTVTDSADRKFRKTFYGDLFTASPPDNTHKFTIPVEKVYKLWGKRRTLRVSIAADANNGFEDHYESMNIDAVEISAGTEKPLTVSLRPKSKGSPQNKTSGPPNRFNV